MPARPPVVGVLAALALLTTAAPTHAADADARIAHIEPGTELRLLVSVPPDAEVDLDGVTVTVDGEEAVATAEATDDTLTIARTAVLALDTSESMRGQRFAAAQGAARAFLSRVPDDVAVGIVTFAGDVQPALQPTTDRVAAAEVVDQLDLSPRTRLYDGVLAAVDMAGTQGQRSILVLSDGGADTSETLLGNVTTTVTGAGTTVDVVALDRGRAGEALEQLAAAGEGSVVDATPQALTRTFTDEAAVLADQLLVTAEIPAAVSGREAPLEVTVPTDSGRLVAEAFAPIRRGSVQEPVPDVREARSAGAAAPGGELLMYAGVGVLGLGLLLAGLLLVPRKPKPLTPAELAESYTAMVVGRHAAAVAGADESEQALAAQATGAAGRVLERNEGLETRIARRLDGAGNPLKPAEWLVLHTAIFVTAGLLGLLLSGGGVGLTLLFLLLGGFGPWMWLLIARARRRKAFEQALPETLQLMAGSLAAGLSLAQSTDTIVREGVEPVASEFRRVLVEARLGVTLEDALDAVAERFASQDFAWAVMAIRIQRQVGGNLAELLDKVAATMREREYMRRQVAALAAEGKLSAWVLGGLPPLFMVYLLLTNYDYVIVMFREPLGWAMLGGAALLLGIGVFWMSRLIKVEV